MPLTPQQDDEEYELRMEPMNANIAQMHANEEKLRSEMRHADRTFLLQALVAFAAVAGASAALGSYFTPRTGSAPTIIVNIPPYAPQVAPMAAPLAP